MVILGLGSNQGDRLTYLRRALADIKKIPQLSVQQISPIYVSDALLPENALAEWDKPYFNLALRCETSLSPYELLAHTKAIEKKIGRIKLADWGPRIIDIDLLAWDDLIQYDEKLHIPHEHLHQRPFALWPLADVAPDWIYPLPNSYQGKTAAEMVLPWGSRFDGHAVFHTRQIAQRIDTPELMGIINLTPDSFSDGGQFIQPQQVLGQIAQLIDCGAEIIDLGAEATNSTAAPISAETEWQRLAEVLEVVMAARANWLVTPKISIDTRHVQTAERALLLGVDWINDVSGLQDTAMRQLLAEHTCDIVFMHHLGIPVDKKNVMPRHQNVIAGIKQWAEQRIAEIDEAGIASDRLIMDIGIGFGKTAEQNLKLLNEIEQFHSFGLRLLVGHSRKLFINQFTDKTFAERDIETVVLSLFLADKKVDYLRVHNPDLHARAFKVKNGLR